MKAYLVYSLEFSRPHGDHLLMTATVYGVCGTLKRAYRGITQKWANVHYKIDVVDPEGETRHLSFNLIDAPRQQDIEPMRLTYLSYAEIRDEFEKGAASVHPIELADPPIEGRDIADGIMYGIKPGSFSFPEGSPVILAVLPTGDMGAFPFDMEGLKEAWRMIMLMLRKSYEPIKSTIFSMSGITKVYDMLLQGQRVEVKGEGGLSSASNNAYVMVIVPDDPEFQIFKFIALTSE